MICTESQAYPFGGRAAGAEQATLGFALLLFGDSATLAILQGVALSTSKHHLACAAAGENGVTDIINQKIVRALCKFLEVLLMICPRSHYQSIHTLAP